MPEALLPTKNNGQRRGYAISKLQTLQSEGSTPGKTKTKVYETNDKALLAEGL
jgi:hypothetical protein